ncbi:hypothetical protein QBC47DRAFT_427356 [Echria macrotheca]|uniref:Acetylesterase n=1 Tax=Echria macrotheca TaxID=438768 RepID=A0AAJ0BLQ7_9PEZI|nr:hypothetical protein QBC47DRAFT_427356 [Echria macrotheca]
MIALRSFAIALPVFITTIFSLPGSSDSSPEIQHEHEPRSTTAVSPSGIKYLITFGDSYSQTGFNITSAKPSPANPLGNPPFPGWTASGGENWIGFLTASYNASVIYTYNFAYGGATTNASLVTPWKPEVLSFVDQVALFEGNVGGMVMKKGWRAEDVLVGVWMGVNDVGNGWWKEDWETVLGEVMDSYFGELGRVWGTGARNFVLLGVPPINKTPSVLTQPVSSQTAEAAAIAKYNDALAARLAAFITAHPGVTATLVDTSVPFNKALDNPTKYGAPNATCYNGDGVSCLWFNDYHPGVAINRLVAEEVARGWPGFFKV